MIRKQPYISIITIVYNGEINIEKTVLSVINQSYNHVEYLIIDGGSTDKTNEIIKKYSHKINYYVSEADNGIYDAMNKGTMHARGDWILFLGAGDTLYPILDKVAERLENSNTVYYGDVYHNDIKRIYDGKFSAFKLSVNNICQQAIFYPASILSKHQFNTKYKILADHELNIRCFGDSQFEFKYIPIVISNYEGSGLSSLNYDLEFYKDKIAIVRENLSFLVFLYVKIRKILGKFRGNNYTRNGLG